MKTKIILWMMAFIFAIPAAFGQEQQQKQQARKSPAEREKERIENLTKTLKLSADQKKKVTTLFQNNRKEMSKMRETMKGKTREEIQELMQERTNKHNAEMKKILSSAQYKQYIEIQKKERKNRPNFPPGGGPRPGNMPPPPGQ